MSERRLILLDSVGAARALLDLQRPAPTDEILSTHYSVVGFLKERGIACRDVTDDVSAERGAQALKDAQRTLDQCLDHLDATLAERMCVAAGFARVAIFRCAFKYLGQYQLAGLMLFEDVLRQRIATAKPASVVFHHYRRASDDPVYSFVRTAERICGEMGARFTHVSVVPPPATALRSLAVRVRGLCRAVVESPHRVLEGAQRRLRSLRWRIGTTAGGPVALLFAAQHDSFVAGPLVARGMQLVSVAPDGSVKGGGLAPTASDAVLEKMVGVARQWLASAGSTLERALVTALIGDARALLLPSLSVHRLLQSVDVRLAAWDAPLVMTGGLNIAADVCLSAGLPVIGRQHGANYGDQNLGSIHFDSDFNRCTHYLSFGFGAAEFAAAYPDAKPRCTFVPAGNAVPHPVRTGARELDIAFPISLTLPLDRFTRMPEGLLVRRQRHILHAMEARTDLRCVLKPPPNPNADTFAHMESLSQLRHVRVVATPWRWFLRHHRPRLIVFDLASTPLYEALAFDADMFLLLDPTFPFSEVALGMLRKRVHIFRDETELAAAIGSYGRDRLPRLRDDQFYRTFVNRGSPEEAFDRLAQGLFGDSGAVRRVAAR